MFSQTDSVTMVFKNNIRQFYDFLYKGLNPDFINNCNHIDKDQLIFNKDKLTRNIGYSEMQKLIYSSQRLDVGLPFSEILILTFPDNYKLYFDIGYDVPIGYIYLNDGSNIFNPNLKMIWSGVINSNSHNSFEYIYESKDLNSKIIKKILPNQLFDYSPIEENGWYPVFYIRSKIGYIQKKNVLMFQYLPIKTKRKLLKDKC